jgi:hypothetical protein
MFDRNVHLQCSHCWKVPVVQRVAEVLMVQMQRTPKEKENNIKKIKIGGPYNTE